MLPMKATAEKQTNQTNKKANKINQKKVWHIILTMNISFM